MVRPLFIKKNNSNLTAMKEAVAEITKTATDICNLLEKKMVIEPLDNTATLRYLKTGISREKVPINFNDKGFAPFFLDHVLPDQTLINSSPMKLGDEYIPILTIKGFPSQSWPAMLDAMNAAGCEFRWVNRFICMDKEEAKKAINAASDKWFGARTSWKEALIKATSDGEGTGKLDRAAIAQGDDSDEALVAVDQDSYAVGYFTSTVMVWDKNKKVALKKLSEIKGIIQSMGFVCCEEKANRFQAFLGMMPGNVYANIRRTSLTSLNFAHIIPLSSIWAGDIFNPNTKKVCGVDVPLMVCSTHYNTPFYFNLNVGDVGMAAIVGPIGAGKSTLLQKLELHFKKYTGSRVYILDKGKSARQLTMAMGGKYFEPGSARVAFQPLEQLDTYEDRLWAIEFVEDLLRVQDISVTTKIKQDIADAINSMSHVSVEQRTITTLQQSVNNEIVREALIIYTISGKYGQIFDADKTSIESNDWLMLEMEKLISLGNECLMPALSYIFRFFDKKFNDNILTLLVLDEAAQFFKIPYFAAKFRQWIKDVRKKNVYVVLATQEIADIVESGLCTTITEECLTKIYLANPEATTPVVAGFYHQLGMSQAEIMVISRAIMKMDYYYKSPKGTRLFQLDLDKNGIALGLIGSQDHELLDRLEQEHLLIFKQAEKKKINNEPLNELEISHYVENYSYAASILEAKGIKYQHLMEEIA